MSIRFEAYLSSQVNLAERRYVLVVYQEGKGKFRIRRQIDYKLDTISYLITSFGFRFSDKREEILKSLPSALEDLFNQGALTVSYVEGDALIEFPAEYSERLDTDRLEELAQLALKGLAPLVKDYADPLFPEMGNEIDYPVTALQLCVFVVLSISLIMYFYGNSVLPLEWMGVAAYSFTFAVMLGVLFSGFTRSLIRTGKALTLCFFCASAILVTLLIGVVSNEIGKREPVFKEGIIESTFEGTNSNVMRIRLASKPDISYLVSREFLKQTPERLPQAIRVAVVSGFFNTHYVRGIEIIQ